MPEQGKVKWFSNVKGFGFLQKEGLEQDIFVHYSSVVSEGYKTLDSGEEVSFEIVQGEKGPQAKDVVRTKKAAKKAEEAQAAAKQAEAAPAAESKEKVQKEKPAAAAAKEKS